MKKVILLMAAFAFTAQISNAAIDKAEKKRIKKELKNYKKNPEQFKAMIENYKTTIDSNESTLNKQKKDLIDAATNQSQLEQKLAALDKDLTDCRNKPVPVCPELKPQQAPGTIPSTGTVYKVQIGLYSKFDLTEYFATPKYVGSEKVDNMNAYVVSYFDTEAEAQKFKGDLHRLGLRDAFVSKYTDGQRVYEWNKNPRFKGKKAPASLEEGLQKK